MATKLTSYLWEKFAWSFGLRNQIGNTLLISNVYMFIEVQISVDLVISVFLERGREIP